MGGSEFAAAVGAFHAAVERLLDSDLAGVEPVELAGLFRDLETDRRRMEAIDHAMVAQLHDAQVAGEFGRTSTAELLVELTRIAPAEAAARVRAARDLGPRREPCGLPLAPIFPRVAEAQRSGSISAAHAKVITSTVAAIPHERSFELAEPVEAFLVEQAEKLDPKRLAAATRRLLATVDPDGAAPSEAEQQRRRDFTIAQNRAGYWGISGCVTDEYAAIWSAMIDALSAPQPAADGMADDRAPGQRRHDAMLELGRRLLHSGALPDVGGTPVTVSLTVRVEDIEGCAGVATTESGNTIAMTAAMRLADECELFTTVLDRYGAILCAGRTRRLANRAQRRVLAARDGGCSFPGCTRPASWCDVHHVVAWIDGGPTDTDNLVLLCGWHHREFERRGWLVRMSDGVPEWIPPLWLDPAQLPCRNTAHHLPEFEFTAGTPNPARGP